MARLQREILIKDSLSWRWQRSFVRCEFRPVLSSAVHVESCLAGEFCQDIAVLIVCFGERFGLTFLEEKRSGPHEIMHSSSCAKYNIFLSDRTPPSNLSFQGFVTLDGLYASFFLS